MALNNLRFKRKPKVLGSQDVELLILSEKYLTSWVALSMSERVQKIWKTFRVKVSISTLRLFYLRNNIKFRKTYSCYRGNITRKPELEAERKSYATVLDYLIEQKASLCYWDESSFNTWTSNYSFNPLNSYASIFQGRTRPGGTKKKV